MELFHVSALFLSLMAVLKRVSGFQAAFSEVDAGRQETILIPTGADQYGYDSLWN